MWNEAKISSLFQDRIRLYFMSPVFVISQFCQNIFSSGNAAKSPYNINATSIIQLYTREYHKWLLV